MSAKEPSYAIYSRKRACGNYTKVSYTSMALEDKRSFHSALVNSSAASYCWRDLSITVKHRVTKEPVLLLDKVSGYVEAGQLVGLLGPSGSGKTTLLNTLAHRDDGSGSTMSGTIEFNGEPVKWAKFRNVSRYVEQSDALIGSLTVRESIRFAADLGGEPTSRREREENVEAMIASFGLQQQSDTLVGTPIQKGLSGGQKRRLSIACLLMTNPKVLFLDEPTSGLDSAASHEVMRYVKEVARAYKIMIVASIHQPSTRTFELFDNILLLSRGKTCYFGSPSRAIDYISQAGFTVPENTNTSEVLLDLVNVDFAGSADGHAKAQLANVQNMWTQSAESHMLEQILAQLPQRSSGQDPYMVPTSKSRMLKVQLVLLHRAWIKSYRDIVAYHVRIAMYFGLAIMMGTVFLRLGTAEKYIQPKINGIFFGGAFMSFMAVAYVPSFLEDRANFVRERANGFYGPTNFLLSNFIIGLPYLFIITVMFSIITYWLSNYRANGSAFFIWVMWLFLDLVAAESLVVLMTSLFPIFVVALAATAFANGLWMCVGGFLVPMTILNPFWKYVFHYINYQAYVFQGMLVNDFRNMVFECSGSAEAGYSCMYESPLNSIGKIDGVSVLKHYGYHPGLLGEWVGIMIAIIVGLRLLGLAALYVRTRH